jgi:hypothetical protein
MPRLYNPKRGGSKRESHRRLWGARIGRGGVGSALDGVRHITRRWIPF